MIRYIILFVYFYTLSSGLPDFSTLGALKSSQQKIEYDRIVWSSTVKLTWQDFLGKPDTSSRYKAMTYTKVRLINEKLDDKIILNFPATFNRSLSWVKDTKSISLLKHEQIHFDIAELAARKLRKDCSKHVSYDLSSSYKFIQSTYDYYSINYKDSIDDFYDLETNHGMLKSKQKEWEDKIAKELKDLEWYADTKVTIERVKPK